MKRYKIIDRKLGYAYQYTGIYYKGRYWLAFILGIAAGLFLATLIY